MRSVSSFLFLLVVLTFSAEVLTAPDEDSRRASTEGKQEEGLPETVDELEHLAVEMLRKIKTLKDSHDVGEAFASDMLVSHNFVRLVASAGSLSYLDWSADLANFAEQQLRKMDVGCLLEHTAAEDRRQVAGFRNVGENLYIAIDFVPTTADVLDAWFQRIRCYRYGPVGNQCTIKQQEDFCKPVALVRAFTQLFWSKTTHVGCAALACSSSVPVKHLVMCTYGAANQLFGGNVVGEYPFDENVADSMSVAFGLEKCYPKTEETQQTQQTQQTQTQQTQETQAQETEEIKESLERGAVGVVGEMGVVVETGEHVNGIDLKVGGALEREKVEIPDSWWNMWNP